MRAQMHALDKYKSLQQHVLYDDDDGGVDGDDGDDGGGACASGVDEIRPI